MAAWLAANFLKVGIIGLVLDLLNRFYFQIVMSWLTDVMGQRGATFDQTLLLAHVSTTLDILASLFWWLFMLGFAQRVLSEIRTRRDGV